MAAVRSLPLSPHDPTTVPPERVLAVTSASVADLLEEVDLEPGTTPST